MYMPGALRSPKKALASLDLSAAMWVLGIELRTSGRAAGVHTSEPALPPMGLSSVVVLSFNLRFALLSKGFMTELHPLPFVCLAFALDVAYVDQDSPV